MKKKTYKKKKNARREVKPKGLFKPTLTPLEGELRGSGRGYAFFIPDDGSGDLYIPARSVGDAIHGDRVLAVKLSERRGSGEGEVIKVLKRERTAITGVFDGSRVIPDDKGFSEIKTEKGGVFATPGEKVAAELITTGGRLRCRITEVLGLPGETDAEIKSVIRSAGLPESFPRSVMAEARALPSKLCDDEIRGRRDFRKQVVVTIDGDDSKDFDDAIAVEKTNDGYRLFVHIADVAHYVRENTKLDAEAFSRGTSVYLADRVIPMLPEKLSNGICSLNEGEDRLTLSVIIDFDLDGEPVSHEIVEGVIRSSARLTYKGVQRVLDGDENEIKKVGELAGMLKTAEELAKKLNARRMARGAVEFDIAESEIVMDGDDVKDVKRSERLFSHRLIEEFMLAANETVAEHYLKKNVPFVFRVHELPPEEKLDGLNAFLAPLGKSVPEKPEPRDYAELLAGLNGDVKDVVGRIALRSMSKAEYKPQNLGHFGLAAEYYCHFTSPIRRYPDLAIHRIIKAILHGESVKRFEGFVAEASVRSSARERLAEESERRVDDILKAKYMSGHIGEEYAAVISGVTEWGIFAELDNTVEGLIRTESLGGYGFKYDDSSLTLSNGVVSYRMGDRIRVRVEAAGYDKVAFSLVR